MIILCKMGIHRWGKSQIHFDFDSNVKDYQKVCLGCGKVKKWNVPV